MNYKQRDDELIKRQKALQAQATKKQNKQNNVYSQKALEELAKGNYKKVPSVQATPTKTTTTKTNEQTKPSTRYQNKNIQKSVETPRETTRDTRYDKDFDDFHEYRYARADMMDYDQRTGDSVPHWQNLKKQIMSKNKWTEQEFDEKWEAYDKERNQKDADKEVKTMVELGKSHPVLGSILSLGYTPQTVIEGGATMLSNLDPDEKKAQSAEAPAFTGMRAQTGLQQAVRDEHIKSGVGQGVYNAVMDLPTMALGPATYAARSAERAQMNALERGVDPNKASKTALAAGAASYATNKLGDKVTGKILGEGKSALGALWRKAVGEGGENFAEDTSNIIVDALMNKDKSQLSAVHDYYVSQGMSDSDATKMTILSTLGDLGTSFGTGALWGGLMSGATNLPALKAEIGASAKLLDFNNRGGVDVPAVLEEFRKNTPAPAKVTPLEGEALDANRARFKEASNELVQVNKDIKAQQDVVDALKGKKNKKAEYNAENQKLKDLKARAEALRIEKGDLNYESKGEQKPFTKYLEQYDKGTSSGMFGKNGFLNTDVGIAVKLAGDTPEAKALRSEIEKSARNVINSYGTEDWNMNMMDLAYKMADLEEMARTNNVPYTSKNGYTYKAEDIFGPDEDALFNKFSDNFNGIVKSYNTKALRDGISEKINSADYQPVTFSDGTYDYRLEKAADGGKWNLIKLDENGNPLVNTVIGDDAKLYNYLDKLNKDTATNLNDALQAEEAEPIQEFLDGKLSPEEIEALKAGMNAPDEPEVDPNNVIYHAGTLSRLNKADTTGKMEGMRDTGYFGTGHYFVDADHRKEIGKGTSYGNKPYSSVDISKYNNLYKADTDAKANKLHDFSQKMMRYINKYNDKYYKTDGEIDPLARDNYLTDLYGQYLELFPDNHMKLNDFVNKLDDMRNGYEHDLYDRGDSAFTTFMKEHGYNGVDTRGTRSAGTERGVVIYDLDEDSVLQSNVTDEAIKNGLMNTRVRGENPVFDTATDEKIQGDIDSFNSRKKIKNEYNKLFDDKAHRALWHEIVDTRQAISDLETEGVEHYKSIIEDDAYLDKAAKLRQKEFARMGLDEDLDVIKEDMRKYAEDNIAEVTAKVEQEKARLAEMQQKYDADEELSKQAYEQARKNVLGTNKNEVPNVEPTEAPIEEPVIPNIKPTEQAEPQKIPSVEEPVKDNSIFKMMGADELKSKPPRTDNVKQSLVGTNTAINSKVFTQDEIENNPIIKGLNSYLEASNKLTFDAAKKNVIENGSTLLDEYTSGRRKIDTDLDVDQAMLMLTELSTRINDGDTNLTAQRNLLFSRLRTAGTLYGQTIQAFAKWNNTAEGLIANGNGIIHEPVEVWKSQNHTKKEMNGRIAKALAEMGVDSSMRNKTSAEKTHEQRIEGIKNVLEKEFGSIDAYFNDNDLEVLANWDENKVPVWQITDEIEHKLATGEWYSLDESTQPKYPINQRLKNALDELVKQEPVEKEPPTLDDIKNSVRATLDKEMAKEGFDESDVDYLSAMIQNGATKEELAEMLNTRMATGKYGISEKTQQDVVDLFRLANKYPEDSKQAFDLKTAAYKMIAEEAVSEDATPFEKFESWRYLAMLGNPRTMIRNWVGNKMFGAVTGVSNNLSAVLEAGVDKASKKLGGEGIQRTKAILNPVDDRSLIKAAGEDGDLHRYSYLVGDKYERGTKDAIKKQKSAFNSKAIRQWEALTNRGISDYSAVKKKYSTSLAGYMKANGLDESAFEADGRYHDLLDKSRTQLLTDAEKAEMNNLKSTADLLEKARDYAVKQAEYATFHEDNEVAKAITELSNRWRHNKHAVVRGMGYGIEGMLPFKKTPANILKSGAQFSPLGAVESVIKTGKLIYENTGKRKGNLEDTYKRKTWRGDTVDVNRTLASDVIDSWSRNITGTGLMIMGMWLKDKGIITSSTKDEKWQDNLEGIQNYGININGHTYSLDWAAPAVMPLLMGAELSKIKEKNLLLDKNWYENLAEITNTVNAILDPMFETSMMQNVKDTMEQIAKDFQYNNDGSAEAIGGIVGDAALNMTLGYLSQGIPTVAGQLARTIDNTRRTTDTKNDGVIGVIEKQGRKVMNKLPGLSFLNPEYRDSYGRTQQNGPHKDPLRNLVYQTLSPGYYSKQNTTAADESARNVYNAEGENGKPMMNKDVFPSWKSRVSVSDEKFTPEEMATYRQASGEAQYAIRDALAKDEWFNSLDGPKQAEVLKSVNTLVDKIGKEAVGKNDSSSDDLRTYQKGGVPELLTQWSGNTRTQKFIDESGLDRNYNITKEIDGLYKAGKIEEADALAEKTKKQNEERLRLNEKYGVNIKMQDYINREKDKGVGANEEWAKKNAKNTSTTKTTSTQTAKTTQPVTTAKQTNTSVSQEVIQNNQKYIERAGSQSRKYTNDLPKLDELKFGGSEKYTYAYAINQDSSLTPEKFNTQFKKMDLNNNGSMAQDEMIDYFNRNKTSQKDGQYLWRTYGENKGKSWKAKAVYSNGVWVKQK